MRNDVLTMADIGEHYIYIQDLSIPTKEESQLLRVFLATFADMYATEEGETFLGAISRTPDEYEEGEYQNESI